MRTAITLILTCLVTDCFADNNRPNILLIAVDDLRPELRCYGKQHIHSPNIDQLAKSGVHFTNAYCMVPTCGASRASLMTGLRPHKSRFVNYLAWSEKEAPGITTLNTQLKNNGYYTLSLGKIFHHPTDNSHGWSKPAWRPKSNPWYRDPKNQKLHNQRQSKNKRKRGPAWESADVPDDAYRDGQLANRAVDELRKLNQRDQPFFLAVGFFKPHLPFIAPEKYWKLYDAQKIRIPENYYIPKNAPKASIHSSGELRAYAGIPPRGAVSNETARKLIHGYYACVSYTDAQIGKLLNELDRLKLSKNTIVVLWGDHGWNLGEHTLWCKHSCYETSMHIPLIVRVPGIPGGKKSKGLIESIDIYPSLCELTGIPLPEHLQGQSFKKLLSHPDIRWKSAAVGRYRNGDTIRTEGFRYTEYLGATDNPLSRMLYNHSSDPDENHNIISQKKFNSTVQMLSKMLHHNKGRDN